MFKTSRCTVPSVEHFCNSVLGRGRSSRPASATPCLKNRKTETNNSNKRKQAWQAWTKKKADQHRDTERVYLSMAMRAGKGQVCLE